MTDLELTGIYHTFQIQFSMISDTSARCGCFGQDGRWQENPELARALGQLGEDDGNFFMCWEDFRRMFNTVRCCRRRRTHSHSSADYWYLSVALLISYTTLALLVTLRL